MWVSLAIMLGESLSSLTIIGVKAGKSFWDSRRRRIDRERYGVEKLGDDADEETDPAPPEQQVPKYALPAGII